MSRKCIRIVSLVSVCPTGKKLQVISHFAGKYKDAFSRNLGAVLTGVN